MPVRKIVRTGSGTPVNPVGGPSWNTIRVNPSTDTLVFGTGTSGTTEKTALDNTTTGQAIASPTVFGAAGSVAGGVTTVSSVVKLVTGMADGSGVDIYTVTIPNAAHACTIVCKILGSMGAGGAVGAFESNSGSLYVISVARTAGATAVVATSSQVGVANGKVSGADTLTATLAASAVSGAASATQTFTIQATLSRGAGASTNHRCIVYADLINANASGITIA